MGKHDLLALRRELEALAVAYWHVVDMTDGSTAPSYYVASASFATSVREYGGRAAIEAYYAARKSRSARVTLHLMNNFRIEVEGDGRVRCRYALSLFAADGEPVLPSRPPILVSTVEELALRQPDGCWLYQLRRVRPLFHDGSPSRG